jgi:hypothetical protein
VTARRSRARLSLALVTLVALGNLGVLEPGAVEGSVRLRRSLEPADRVELRSLRAAAKAASRDKADEAWYRVAVFALGRAPSIDDPADEDDHELAKILREACDHLSVGSLAAVAAHGSHPILSRRFCDVVIRSPLQGGANESAAEARDGLRRFGGKTGRDLIRIVEKGDRPAPGAGGAQRSVFAIRVILSAETDAQNSVVRGIQAGIRASAGGWANRFDVRPRWVRGHESIPFAIDEGDGPVRPGVIVVAAEGGAHAAALAHGLAEGALIVDARVPEDHFSSGSTGSPADSGGLSSGSMPDEPSFGGPGLEYLYSISSGFGPRREWQQWCSFTLLPPGIERGRRLAEHLRSRPEIDAVVIALPEAGGDLQLARGFERAARALGRSSQVLVYAPGRRDFMPEARRFIATGAKAILFAGPGEESSEFLGALNRARVRPLVLGSNELAPEGFHSQARPWVEGAIYVGEEWEDRDSTFARGEVAARAESAPTSNPVEFARGYRFGAMLARAVIAGNATPSSLARELSLRALPGGTAVSTRSLVRFGDSSASSNWSVELPIHEVRGGTPVRRSTR